MRVTLCSAPLVGNALTSWSFVAQKCSTYLAASGSWSLGGVITDHQAGVDISIEGRSCERSFEIDRNAEASTVV